MISFEQELYYWTHMLDEAMYSCDYSYILNEKASKNMLKLAAKKKALDLKIEDKDLMLRKDIPHREVKRILGSAYHNVSNFSPDFIKKALYNDKCRVFGLFDKNDKRNALAIAAIVENYGPSDDCAYLHEMAGFRKGGFGKKLVMMLLDEYGKLWWQSNLTEEDGKFKINDKLSEIYRSIPSVNEHIVENSIWKCDCNFFYKGIDEDVMEQWLDDQYLKKDGK